jgi:hypothetical protein
MRFCWTWQGLGSDVSLIAYDTLGREVPAAINTTCLLVPPQAGPKAGLLLKQRMVSPDRGAVESDSEDLSKGDSQ